MYVFIENVGVEESKISLLPISYPNQSSNINNALIKKATTNIDVHTMGNQGIFVVLLI